MSPYSGRIAGLLGHSAVYAAANVLQRGLAFLLVPVYAAYFSASEFGAMDILYQAVLTASIAVSLGLPQGLVRGFFPPDGDGPVGAAGRRAILGALVTLLVPLCLAVTAAALVFSDSLARALFHGEGKAGWVRLAAWLLLAMVLQQLPLQLLKTIGRPRAFAAWSLANFALAAGGNLYGIAALRMGVEGMLGGNLLGAGATAAGMWLTLMPGIRPNFAWGKLRPLFAFGLPMLPNLLCRKVLETASRYILPLSWGLAEVGIFSMGARVAAILDILLLTPFLYAWQPFFYAQARHPEAPRIFARVTHYVLIVMSLVLVALQCLQGPLLDFLGRGKYAAAAPVATWLAVAVACNGLQYCVSAGLHLRGKLVAEMGLMAVSAVVSLAANFLLARRFGAAGAAASTAAGYAFYLAASFALAKRVFPVPYLWKRGAWIAAAALAAGAGAAMAHGLLPKAGILAAFLGAGPGIDLARHGELSGLGRWAARVWRKPAPSEDKTPIGDAARLAEAGTVPRMGRNP